MTIASLLFYWMSLSLHPVPVATNLQLHIEGIQEVSGDIYVAVYDSAEAFPEDETWCYRTSEAVRSSGTLELAIPGRSAGTYAIAIYHDTNGNGQLDKNMVGIPQEPYGFSRNPRAKWKAPTFTETAFEVPSSSVITIELKRWKER